MLLAVVIRESFVEGSTPELSLEGPACAKISTGRETRKGGAKDVTENTKETVQVETQRHRQEREVREQERAQLAKAGGIFRSLGEGCECQGKAWILSSSEWGAIKGF